MSHRHLLPTTAKTKGWTLPFLQTCLPSSLPPCPHLRKWSDQTSWAQTGSIFGDHCCRAVGPGMLLRVSAQGRALGPCPDSGVFCTSHACRWVTELSPTHSLRTSPFGCHLCLLGRQGWGGPGDGPWSISKAVLASVLSAGG